MTITNGKVGIGKIEPTTALDVTVQAEIVQLLKELSDELNISFFGETFNMVKPQDVK